MFCSNKNYTVFLLLSPFAVKHTKTQTFLCPVIFKRTFLAPVCLTVWMTPYYSILMFHSLQWSNTLKTKLHLQKPDMHYVSNKFSSHMRQTFFSCCCPLSAKTWICEAKPEFFDVMHIFAKEMGDCCKLFHSCE